MTQDKQGFQAPQTITPDGLADDLAVLVWESFTDFVSEWESSSTLAVLGLVDDDGQPDRRAVEEALIFLMWAHTRGTQQAFVGRAPAEPRQKDTRWTPRRRPRGHGGQWNTSSTATPFRKTCECTLCGVSRGSSSV